MLISAVLPHCKSRVALRKTFRTLDGLMMVLQKPILPRKLFPATPRTSIRRSPTTSESLHETVVLLVPLPVIILSESLAAPGELAQERAIACVVALVTIESRASGEAF